jgi:hypothetical protein
LPFLLILGFVVAETIHCEVVLRETRINITEPARLRRATRYTTNDSTDASLTRSRTYGYRLWEWRRELRPSPR